MLKGRDFVTLISDPETIKRVNAAIQRLLGRAESFESLNEIYASMNLPPQPLQPMIDLSKPNMHDTKKEFQAEYETVAAIVDNMKDTIHRLYPPDEKKTPEQKSMVDKLRSGISLLAEKGGDRYKVTTPYDLILKNVYQVDFYTSSLLILAETRSVYQLRLRELEEQKTEFWSGGSRPPNYYARTIALRLARLYAKEKHQRPTFGVSREGNFPSTDFGRAIEEIFQALGIKAAFRLPAQWAIDQLTEEDLNPPRNALAEFLDFGGKGLGAIPPEMRGKGLMSYSDKE